MPLSFPRRSSSWNLIMRDIASQVLSIYSENYSLTPQQPPGRWLSGHYC